MALPLTALYGGILAIILSVLSARAGLFRAKAGISIGDGGNVELHERIRVHGNAVEYVPMFIILFGILETNGANTTFLHAIGIVVILSRVAHAVGLKADNIAHPLRAVGAGGTALATMAAAIYAIWQFGANL